MDGYIGLVLLAVVTSLIGIYYYFRIIIAMYLKSSDKTTPIEVPILNKILLVICLVITVALGIFPDLLISLL